MVKPQSCSPNDAERDSGRTTRQMQGAPRDAVYVWCNSATWYARRLAHGLNRGDLLVVPLSRIERPDYWRGLHRPVVIDHAAYDMMTLSQLRSYDYLAKHLRAAGVVIS